MGSELIGFLQQVQQSDDGFQGESRCSAGSPVRSTFHQLARHIVVLAVTASHQPAGSDLPQPKRRHLATFFRIAGL